ncbi:hypothetical protein JG688_00014416 [Phytophthora aleatoria]|uniref:Uncharacterized protein n=1 Tax=Phytophthora aleatoria TaxID=2496075 RepID=A0A8J5IJW8_9STRA|nr:hypothetical protein JG688_00014416 [Phytophthora aleatoria]
MPMNINVDKARATIYSYDSFDKRANQNPQAEVADELIKKVCIRLTKLSLYTAPSRKMVTTAVCSYAYTSGGACVRKRATTTAPTDYFVGAGICCAPW